MHTKDIADALSRVEWETLKALGAPQSERAAVDARIHDEALRRLVQSDLVALAADRPSVTEKGRKVVVCGSPTLWNG